METKTGRGLRGWDADGGGFAGAEGAAWGWMESFVEADFDGGEVVAAASQSEAGARQPGVCRGEESEDLVGGHRSLRSQIFEDAGDGDGLDGRAGGGEEVIGGQAGAGAVGVPFVLEEAEVGIDVFVLGGIGGAGGVGAVLWIGAVLVFGPQAVEDEGGVHGALGGGGMGVAKLRRPGEVEEIEIKVGGGVRNGSRRRARGTGRLRRGWGRAGVAGGYGKKREEEEEDSLLHGRKDSRLEAAAISTGVCETVS